MKWGHIGRMGAAMAIEPRRFAVPIMSGLKAIALVALATVATYFATSHQNVESALQQQNAAAVQQFEASGSQMDAALSLYVDALLDGRDVAQARKDARAAITLHAAQASPLRPLAGNGNVDQYVNGLGDLRKFADDADGRLTAKTMAQQHVNLMAYRVKLVSLARGNIYQ